MERKLDKARELVSMMNGSPKQALKLSKKALALLEKVPDSRKTDEEILLCRGVVEVASTMRKKVREIYNVPKFMFRAEGQAIRISMFISARRPSYVSIH